MKQYNAVLEELKIALSQQYNKRTELQKKKDMIDNIEKIMRESLVTDEMFHTQNDFDTETKFKLENINNKIQSLRKNIPTFHPPPKTALH